MEETGKHLSKITLPFRVQVLLGVEAITEQPVFQKALDAGTCKGRWGCPPFF